MKLCDDFIHCSCSDLYEELGEKIRQLFAILEVTEETDEGRVFHPNQIRSCRALDTEKLNTVLADLKRIVNAKSKENKDE